MNMHRKSLLFIGAALFAALFPSGGRSAGWDDVRSPAAKIASVHGDFTQCRHMKILAKPLVSKGTFYFRTPDSLRWEYASPIRSILLTQNGETKRFVQTNGEWVEDASARLQSMQMVIQEIAKWMKGRFDENPAFTSTLESERKIALTPKEASLAALIQKIEIVLSEREGVIASVTIFEGRDSLTRITFDHVVINQPIDDALFRKP